MKKGIIMFKNEHDLVTLIKRVIEKSKGNPAFPNLPAALADLEKVLPELEEALVKAKSRDKEWVAIKNNKKAIAIALLEELAAYVIAASKGDQALILSSGFDAINGQATPPATAIEIVDVQLGAPGEAIVRVKKVASAVAYVHQYTTELPGPNTVWVSEESSIREHKFKGLASDKRHWFRVIAIGRKGQKAISPVVSKSIQ
ncbi:hypothetical protein A3860_21660 [Niastella vici]|uniref:Fibronectin type-III domain-containing protein n=1 Tax=Niastella vici TaxID=1703345 RepID=A0A1V9G0H9_9BACT|nr:hypothetical protein [Niastella vici]OQP64028.1 hypothetical protein A3860_21660 [Niastella vici]